MQRPSFALYDASAGSGKTYALVKEYLKIILTAKKNDAYRNILAITFTNKAVHEMKSRIVGSLSEFAKEHPNEKAVGLMQHLSQETQLSVASIHQKSKSIIKHLIHNYAAFDIATIDKFTHKVIRAFAHDLNLPMTFEVTLDTENLLTEAVDTIIAQAGEDATLTKLLIDFTMEKTDDDKSWDISREILETGQLILNENNREAISHFQNKKIEDFVAIKKKITELFTVLENDNIQLASQVLALINENGIDTKAFPYETFPKHLNFIITKDNREHKHKFLQIEDIKIKKGSKETGLIEQLAPKMIKILAQVYTNNEKKNFYKAFLKNITPLSLLNEISDKLKVIQTEQNVLSISEFNAIIHREIQNQPAPFIYERLGERYRHFFIDEFQDTSEMQWQNLIPLIDNATSSEIDGEKGTLMLVGDPKQSIYRWRGGKAEQFIALTKEQNPFNNPEKVVTHLDKNYRSYSEIINFNNLFFKRIASAFDAEGAGADYKDLYENHSHQKTNDKIGGHVAINFLPINDDASSNPENPEEDTLDKTEKYVLETLNTIQKVQLQGFEYQDIVILTRKRSQGVAIATYLTEQNIPILSSETLMLQNATQVRLIVYLLRYLKNSNDIEAKAHFLQYLASQQTAIEVHDFIAQGMALKKEVEFEKWLQASSIDLSFQNVRKKSLYEAVETIITKFLNPNESNAYVQYFLDIILERDIRNQAGISDFLSYWDKNADKFSIPSPEGKNAVRIMTIHKSKGLEFPVVIFPFADEDYNHKPKNKLWLNADENDFGLPKVLIDNNKSVAEFGSDAKEVYDQKNQEELLDNVNILYVALTRAEEQLYVISQMIKPKKEGDYPNNMAAFFIQFLIAQGVFDENKLNYSFGDPKKCSLHEAWIDRSQTIPLLTQILNPKNIKIAQREALMWGTQRQEAIEYGNIIHEILSFIKTKIDIDLAITKAIENGLITIKQKTMVTQTISEIVNHPELTEYFRESNTILNEQTIIQKEGNTIIPDRMVVTKNNEVLLLDYKTGAHQDKYQSQVDQYQAAIEKMGFKVVKKAIIYIGTPIEIVNL